MIHSVIRLEIELKKRDEAIAFSAADRKNLRQGVAILFYQSKVETVRFYIRNFLAQVFGRVKIIKMADTTQ